MEGRLTLTQEMDVRPVLPEPSSNTQVRARPPFLFAEVV